MTSRGPPLLIPPFRFGTVEQDVYRGAYPKQRNLRYLKRLKLKTILSLIPDPPDANFQSFCSEHGIRWIHLSVDKVKDNVPLTHARAVEAVQIIIDPENSPIYIHCLDGASVTGLVVCCIRKLQTWNISSALGEFLRYLRGGVISSEESVFVEKFSSEIEISKPLPAWLWEGQVTFKKHPTLKLNFSVPPTSYIPPVHVSISGLTRSLYEEARVHPSMLHLVHSNGSPGGRDELALVMGNQPDMYEVLEGPGADGDDTKSSLAGRSRTVTSNTNTTITAHSSAKSLLGLELDMRTNASGNGGSGAGNGGGAVSGGGPHTGFMASTPTTAAAATIVVASSLPTSTSATSLSVSNRNQFSSSLSAVEWENLNNSNSNTESQLSTSNPSGNMTATGRTSPKDTRHHRTESGSVVRGFEPSRPPGSHSRQGSNVTTASSSAVAGVAGGASSNTLIVPSSNSSSTITALGGSSSGVNWNGHDPSSFLQQEFAARNAKDPSDTGSLPDSNAATPLSQSGLSSLHLNVADSPSNQVIGSGRARLLEASRMSRLGRTVEEDEEEVEYYEVSMTLKALALEGADW